MRSRTLCITYPLSASSSSFKVSCGLSCLTWTTSTRRSTTLRWDSTRNHSWPSSPKKQQMLICKRSSLQCRSRPDLPHQRATIIHWATRLPCTSMRRQAISTIWKAFSSRSVQISMLFSTRDRSLGKRSRSTEVLRLLKRLTVNGQVPLGMPLTTVVCPAKDKVFKRYHRRIPVETYPCLGNHTKSNKLYRLISDSRVHTPSISNH